MIRTGIVGLGFMGQQHFAIHQAMADIELVAVCDKEAERRAEQAEAATCNMGKAITLDLSGAERYATIEELLAHDGLDCVDICTPTYLHADTTVKALEAGKHVICEKPMALTSGDCQRMTDAAKANDKLLFIAQCIRFGSAHEKLGDQGVGKRDTIRVLLGLKSLCASPASYLDALSQGAAACGLTVRICDGVGDEDVAAHYEVGARVLHVLRRYQDMAHELVPFGLAFRQWPTDQLQAALRVGSNTPRSDLARAQVLTYGSACAALVDVCTDADLFVSPPEPPPDKWVRAVVAATGVRKEFAQNLYDCTCGSRLTDSLQYWVRLVEATGSKGTQPIVQVVPR